MDHHLSSTVPLQPENTKKSSRRVNAKYVVLIDLDVQAEIDAVHARIDKRRREMGAAINQETEQKRLIELQHSKREALLLERARAAEQLQLELTNQLRLLRGEMAELKQAVICTICMEARCSTAFQCGHLSCGECSSRLSQCHICRRDILQRTHIFL